MNNISLPDIENLIKQPVEKDINKVFEPLRNKDIYVYGAGSFGKEVYSMFMENNLEIKAYIDKNAENIRNINNTEVISPEHLTADFKNSVVVTALVCDKDEREKIFCSLKNKGFQTIIDAQSIRCYYVDFSKDYRLSDDTFKKIEMIYSRLADEKSKNIFLENIYSHLSRDYSGCGNFEDNMHFQYFPDDISFEKGYSSFIDCGGFIGDTVAELMKKTTPKTVVSFEPSIENFKRLSDKCHSYENLPTEFILYNNAVSNDVYQTKFMSGTGSGTISDDGEITVNVVSLDRVLPKYNPTFIKMDIEGEEINALTGAKKMLEESKPDMAICVYHNIDHIWEIPAFINKIDNDYTFFLRNYNSYTMETVLYATKKDVNNIEH